MENNSKFANNTFFKKCKSKKWTRLSPDGNTRNETDICIIDDMKIVEDVSRTDSFKFPSDNRAIKIKILKRITNGKRYSNPSE